MMWEGRAIRVDHPSVTAVAVGSSALSLRVEGPAQAASLAARLRQHGVDVGCSLGTEVVPAATTVLVDGVRDQAAVLEAVAGWIPGHQSENAGALVQVPVTYDGEDLEQVARRWGIEVEEVIVRHTAIEFVATFSGFSPGFTYLAGIPPQWSLPRLDSPRARVPAGSVALADQWCGIYPASSPGGWWLLGRTELTVWDLSRDTAPSLLLPGTRVRFVAA